MVAADASERPVRASNWDAEAAAALLSDDASDVATFHAYKIVAATGTQSATFNWTDSEANQFAGANIATFKAAAAASTELPFTIMAPLTPPGWPRLR
mgnify:CR=1 FL=1